MANLREPLFEETPPSTVSSCQQRGLFSPQICHSVQVRVAQNTGRLISRVMRTTRVNENRSSSPLLPPCSSYSTQYSVDCDCGLRHYQRSVISSCIITKSHLKFKTAPLSDIPSQALSSPNTAYDQCGFHSGLIKNLNRY